MKTIIMKVLRNTTAMAALFISMLTISCSNDEPAFPTDPDEITFTAPTEIVNPSSRVTYRQELNRIKVVWEKGDKVYLVDKNGNKLLEFTIESEPTATKAIFTCTDVITKEDLNNVSGTLKYIPDGASSDYKQVQSANGDTKHLMYANVIESTNKISGASLLKEKQTVEFANNTAIFRIILTAQEDLTSGTTLAIKGGSGWGYNGIVLTLEFKDGVSVPKGSPLTAYIAVPAGEVNGKEQGEVKTMLGFILTPASGKSKYHSYKFLNKTYEVGKEYTADLTQGLTQNYQTFYENGHEYVDLGLKSKTMWATKNVSSQPGQNNEYGDYFAWGNSTPVNEYSQLNTNVPLLTVNEAVTDGNNSSYKDVAKTYWGGKWVTPSQVQCNELLDDCKWEWNSDLNCYMVSSQAENNNAMILLPVAGYYAINGEKYAPVDVGISADYWTSTQDIGQGYANYSYCIQIPKGENAEISDVNDHPFSRSNACPIRPVFVNDN